jgi:hypothetical protein
MTKAMQLWQSALVAGIGAMLVNLILLFALRPLTGVPDTFVTLSPGPVIMWSVLGAVGATLVFALLRRFSRKPRRNFTLTALIVLMLSFIPDVLIHGATTGMFVGATWRAVMLLMTMHIAEAFIILWVFLKRTVPARP